VVAGECTAGPIIPSGPISPLGIITAGGIWAPGFIWPSGPIIAPGFICSPGFILSQQAIRPDPIWSPHGPPRLDLRKNPAKKIAATMNKPPATMPTHANAWFRRLSREGVMSGSSAGVETSVELVIGLNLLSCFQQSPP
jgi:hypothetical protein